MCDVGGGLACGVEEVVACGSSGKGLAAGGGWAPTGDDRLAQG